METIALFGALTFTLLMVLAKRNAALIRSFCCQSFFIFMATLVVALNKKETDLFIVAGLLFVIKVIAIPLILSYIAERIKANENIGLFVNAQLSLFCILGIMYISWRFARIIFPMCPAKELTMLAAAFSITLAGAFMMISRMTAFAQIVGLLVMENGLFLLASSVSGGMPFFVEIAIFFDVFVSVIIMVFFVYRINKLFTHIDINKLSRLKG